MPVLVSMLGVLYAIEVIYLFIKDCYFIPPKQIWTKIFRTSLFLTKLLQLQRQIKNIIIKQRY